MNWQVLVPLIEEDVYVGDKEKAINLGPIAFILFVNKGNTYAQQRITKAVVDHMTPTYFWNYMTFIVKMIQYELDNYEP